LSCGTCRGKWPMTSPNENAEETSHSKKDTYQLCCPHCRSGLRLALVSADIVSSPERLRIMRTGPAETIGAVIEDGGDTLLLAAIERRTILTAVRKGGNDKNLAARMLGIGKTTLYRKLKEYGFDAPSTSVSADIASPPEKPRVIPNAPANAIETIGTDTGPLEAIERAIEKTAILTAMQETENDRQLVARMLGIGRTTLYRRLKEYGVPLSRCTRSKATTR